MTPEERDQGLADLILELIAHLRRRLSQIDLAAFEANRDEIDLTAFRLAAIGESTNKLSATFKAANPEIAWAEIYGLRNVVSNDYLGIRPSLIWQAARHELDALEAACRTIAP